MSDTSRAVGNNERNNNSRPHSFWAASAGFERNPFTNFHSYEAYDTAGRYSPAANNTHSTMTPLYASTTCPQRRISITSLLSTGILPVASIHTTPAASFYSIPHTLTHIHTADFYCLEAAYSFRVKRKNGRLRIMEGNVYEQAAP